MAELYHYNSVNFITNWYFILLPCRGDRPARTLVMVNVGIVCVDVIRLVWHADLTSSTTLTVVTHYTVCSEKKRPKCCCNNYVL